ncbi:MAG: hypothetical protein Q4D96_00940 [Propionibacteriaceae bacterium]|nr:hypothetical protein [Propionibacteriaceae bacterium]
MSTHWQPPQPQGRDPRTPFGSPQQPMPQPAPQIQDYQEPRGSLGRTLLIVVVVVAVIGAVLYGLQVIGGEPQAQSSASPSAHRTAPSMAASSLGASTTSVAFDSYGKGTFEILNSAWGNKGLEVEVQITLTEGQGTYSVYAFHNDSMTSADPTTGEPITVFSGETKTATYLFDLPRGEGTLVLATSSGTPITALILKG